MPPAAVYEAELVAAVKTFQQRHGLTDDGIVGAATLQQLQVAPAARVRQIELTLERLRWTPLMQAPRMIVINIPEFVLRAYEVRDGRIGVRQTMRVIVGKALDTRTPLFDEDMRFIEFSPTGTCRRRSPATNWCRGCGATRPTSSARASSSSVAAAA